MREGLGLGPGVRVGGEGETLSQPGPPGALALRRAGRRRKERYRRGRWRGAGEGGEVHLPKGGRTLTSPSWRVRQEGITRPRTGAGGGAQTENGVPTCPLAPPPSVSLLGVGQKTGQVPPRQDGGQNEQVSQKEGARWSQAVFPGLEGVVEALRPPPLPHWM